MRVIIPARGGSKGLPGKNIRSLLGKPLIAYTIEAALKADNVKQVIVTTDSREIAEVASQYGAQVPFLRSPILASDTASAVEVYLHAVEYLMEENKEKIDKFMVLLPTSPLRGVNEINDAIYLFKEKRASTLVSMVKADIPASWYFGINQDMRVQNAGFGRTDVINNRQCNENYYIPNGAIYILDYNLLKQKRTYYDINTMAYIMDKMKSIDIDIEMDFEFAEFLMKKYVIAGL